SLCRNARRSLQNLGFYSERSGRRRNSHSFPTRRSSDLTFSEINKIANPNQYPEFNKVKELVQSKRDKKQSFDLTSVLGTNTIVSDRKSTRLNSSHVKISYAVFCLKKKKR